MQALRAREHAVKVARFRPHWEEANRQAANDAAEAGDSSENEFDPGGLEDFFNEIGD